MGDPAVTRGLVFRFEWGTGTAFWPADDAARDRFGIGPIDPDDLPLRDETRCRVREVARWHDASLNWDYPPDPGPWRQEECDRFNAAVAALYRDVARELDPAFVVTGPPIPLREDPDLDAYLHDPKGFRRPTSGRR